MPAAPSESAQSLPSGGHDLSKAPSSASATASDPSSQIPPIKHSQEAQVSPETIPSTEAQSTLEPLAAGSPSPPSQTEQPMPRSADALPPSASSVDANDANASSASGSQASETTHRPSPTVQSQRD